MSVEFHIEIPSDCRENCKKNLREHFLPHSAHAYRVAQKSKPLSRIIIKLY